MASPSTLPQDGDVKEIQTQIAGKKKEQALLQVLEKLFNCLVDTDKFTYLSERMLICLQPSFKASKSRERIIRFDSRAFLLQYPLT